MPTKPEEYAALLAALRTVQQVCDNAIEDQGTPQTAIIMARPLGNFVRAAIAKAEGV